MNYGFIPSKMDGTEVKFKEIKDFEIPEEYSYKKYLPDVINQGNKPICVPCSLSAYINWSINTDTGENKVDNEVDLNEIYDSRTTDGNDGMTFKEHNNESKRILCKNQRAESSDGKRVGKCHRRCC
jgi:hypothetical protein